MVFLLFGQAKHYTQLQRKILFSTHFYYQTVLVGNFSRETNLYIEDFILLKNENYMRLRPPLILSVPDAVTS